MFSRRVIRCADDRRLGLPTKSRRTSAGFLPAGLDRGRSAGLPSLAQCRLEAPSADASHSSSAFLSSSRESLLARRLPRPGDAGRGRSTGFDPVPPVGCRSPVPEFLRALRRGPGGWVAGEGPHRDERNRRPAGLVCPLDRSSVIGAVHGPGTSTRSLVPPLSGGWPPLPLGLVPNAGRVPAARVHGSGSGSKRPSFLPRTGGRRRGFIGPRAGSHARPLPPARISPSRVVPPEIPPAGSSGSAAPRKRKCFTKEPRSHLERGLRVLPPLVCRVAGSTEFLVLASSSAALRARCPRG